MFVSMTLKINEESVRREGGSTSPVDLFILQVTIQQRDFPEFFVFVFFGKIIVLGQVNPGLT